jgi:cell filamentation protein
MAEHSRYHVSDKGAGISGGILKNKLNIKRRKRLEETETVLYADTYEHFFELRKENKIKFDIDLLFSIHKYFFDPLYDWAGKVRTVNISKGGMFFAPVNYIGEALEAFNILLKVELSRQLQNKNKLSNALAIIHNEFNVIHPFREGNGRTIRLFLDLIAAKSGYDPVNWGKSSKHDYLKACVDGANGNNEPIARIIKTGLNKSN